MVQCTSHCIQNIRPRGGVNTDLSKLDDAGAELVYELLVVGRQSLHVRQLRALGVEVEFAVRQEKSLMHTRIVHDTDVTLTYLNSWTHLSISLSASSVKFW